MPRFYEYMMFNLITVTKMQKTSKSVSVVVAMFGIKFLFFYSKHKFSKNNRSTRPKNNFV